MTIMPKQIDNFNDILKTSLCFKTDELYKTEYAVLVVPTTLTMWFIFDKTIFRSIFWV